MLLYMGGGAALADHYRRCRAIALADAASACDEMARHAADRLGESGSDRVAMAEALAAAVDAREACAIASGLLNRRSELAGYLMAACADACRRCAEAAVALSEDQTTARGLDACRDAEQVCRRALEVEAA